MIKLLSSAALALTVAAAFSAAPAQATERTQIGLGEFEIHQANGFSSKKFLKKKIGVRSRHQRFFGHHQFSGQQRFFRQHRFNGGFRTGYAVQPHDFAASRWHRGTTNHSNRFIVSPRFRR